MGFLPPCSLLGLCCLLKLSRLSSLQDILTFSQTQEEFSYFPITFKELLAAAVLLAAVVSILFYVS